MFGGENPETSPSILPWRSKTGSPGNAEDLFRMGPMSSPLGRNWRDQVVFPSRSRFEPRMLSEDYTHPVMKPACGFEDFPMVFEPDPGTQVKVAIPSEDVNRSGAYSEKIRAGVPGNSVMEYKYPHWDMCGWDSGAHYEPRLALSLLPSHPCCRHWVCTLEDGPPCSA
jgi:hypothetical protein